MKLNAYVVDNHINKCKITNMGKRNEKAASMEK